MHATTRGAGAVSGRAVREGLGLERRVRSTLHEMVVSLVVVVVSSEFLVRFGILLLPQHSNRVWDGGLGPAALSAKASLCREARRRERPWCGHSSGPQKLSRCCWHPRAHAKYSHAVPPPMAWLVVQWARSEGQMVGVHLVDSREEEAKGETRC